jgi:hypothetical protein
VKQRLWLAQTISCQSFWSDEDEGFIALSPDLPGCSAFEESRVQALRNLNLQSRRGLNLQRQLEIQSPNSRWFVASRMMAFDLPSR